MTPPNRPDTPDDGGPGQNGPQTPQPRSPSILWTVLTLAIALGVVVWAIVAGGGTSGSTTSLPYSELVKKVDAHQVSNITVDANGVVTGTLTNGTEFTSQVPTALGGDDLYTHVEKAGVTLAAQAPSSSSSWTALLIVLLPMALLIGFFIWAGRRGGGAVGAMGGGGPIEGEGDRQ